uniref:Uncharacterized protein n=1 Tax=Cacopsylla melanoneura TaxID=428564 RepID=A0A8D8X1T9_9HEMI
MVLGVGKVMTYLMLIGGFALMGFGGYNVFLANKNKVKDVVQNTVRKMDFNGQSSDETQNKMFPDGETNRKAEDRVENIAGKKVDSKRQRSGGKDYKMEPNSEPSARY